MGFNFGIENVIHANLPSFCLMVALFYVLCKKLKVGDILQQKSLQIKDVVDNSEKVKAQSYSQLKNAQLEMERLPQQLEELKKDAVNTANALSENIKAEAAEKTKVIEDNAQKTIDFEVKTTTDKLSKEVSAASITIAKENLEHVLQDNIDMHKKIISDCIDAI